MSSLLLTKYHSGEELKENELHGPCGTYGTQAKCIQVFGGETWKRPHGTPMHIGEVISKWISKK